MGTGSIGGKIGNSVGNFLEIKYGKKRAKFIEAGVGFIVSTLLLYVYLFLYTPVSINDLKEITTKIKSFKQIGKSKKYGTILLNTTDSREFEIESNVWKNKSSASEILNELNNIDEIKLWVYAKDNTTVFGLKTSNLFFEPEEIVRAYNNNRKWLLYLILFFYVISTADLIWALLIKKQK